MRGQTMELLGVVILGVALLGLFLYFTMSSTQGYTQSAKVISDRQDSESFKAGVNAILYTTEPQTGKTIIELLGIASKIGNTTIDFGPEIGEVDVRKELTWRFDATYGRGNWYLRIPFPNLTAEVQIVSVVDTSASMCTQIKTMIEDVPEILEDLRENGRTAEMTMFMLSTPTCCVENEDGKWVPFDLDDFYNETEYFHIVGMPEYCEGVACQNPCGPGGKGEDWGTGMSCAIAMGPYKGPGEFGWKDGVLKIGIPISDELAGGTECGCSSPRGSTTNQNNVEKGLDAALANDVYIFAFRGDACGMIHDINSATGRCRERPFSSSGHCACSQNQLAFAMEEFSNATGGRMYNLSYVVESADSIEEIIMGVQPNRVPYLEAGTVVPSDKEVIHSATTIIPVTILGKYVELYVQSWS